MVHSVARAALTLAVVCLIGCGGSHAATDGHASASAGKPGPAQPASNSTPSAACDDFVRIVTQCVETKMPESERATERQNLAMFKKMQASFPVAAGRMASQCEANIRNAIRQDSYGCYGEEAAKRGIQTACSLLTRAELEGIVGVPLEDGVPLNMKCSYAFAGQPFREPLKITVRWHGGRDEVDAARAAQAMVNGRLAKETGTSDFVPGAKVDGVGDDAFFTLAGIWPMLQARLGDVSIGIEGLERDPMIAIARLALPRIKAERDDQS
jgi:hypothetical protein